VTRAGTSHLECSRTGETFPAEALQTISPAGAPLLARYDLAAIASRWRPEDLAGRRPDLWRYREVLPVAREEAALSLGEGMTPLFRAPRLEGATAGLPGAELWIKDETQNPTGSFKARGLAVAVSRAVELGAPAVALPSAGNAGSAAAAYAALAGVPAYIVMPADTPRPIVAEARELGARVELRDGLITDCAKVVKEGCRRHGWFDLSTLKEPYRLEGKKTMGYELAEQLGWSLPEVIVYPTGGGTGLVGMWKAFAELEALGWIGSARPRMVSVQAAGCAPIVRAWERGLTAAEPWLEAETSAYGLRVPQAIGDFLILQAIRDSGGAAVAVDDDAMALGVSELGRTTGVFSSPEGGAVVAAVPRLVETGIIGEGDRVILFITGSGLKYL
jgi:threonine synthase